MFVTTNKICIFAASRLFLYHYENYYYSPEQLTGCSSPAVGDFFAAGFTACSNEDNSVEAFSAETVVGKWYFETEQHGTYGEGEDAFEFDKIVIYGNLRDDGTGTWYALFFNPYGNLIDTGDLFFAAGCQYSTTADGNVHMELNGQSSITGLMPSWDMTYKSGVLRTADSDSNYQFRHITPLEGAQMQ